MMWPFGELKQNHYCALLIDPPWVFNNLWGGRTRKIGNNYPSRAIERHYDLMEDDELMALPVAELAAENCVLFMWTCWPVLQRSLKVLEAWGFTYKTCAFSWMKADPYRLFADDKTPFAGMGYWTRANTEPCLLATRGKPKRLNADVRQGIIAPRREHSRKPEGIHARIERLVAGPYCELFSRQRRENWDSWGNELDKFEATA
jgi:N6-adenosine-specific RNA methylase IME4